MSDPSQTILDPGALSQLLDLDEDGLVFVEIVETFLRDAPRHVAAMESAIHHQDAKLLDRAAHTLKATSATVGAMALAAICKEVEHCGRSGMIDPARESLPRIREELAHADEALQREMARLRKP